MAITTSIVKLLLCKQKVDAYTAGVISASSKFKGFTLGQSQIRATKFAVTRSVYLDLINIRLHTQGMLCIYPGCKAFCQQEVEGGGGSTNKLSNQLTITSKHLKL